MSDPAGYTVGWICALPVEYIAAQEFLDEEHEKPSFVSPNDANDYTLGKIGEHNIVIAVLPDGEYGTASAANVATNMLNSFHNIRIGLMVGIGGGVPSERHDIRLGDVVVSAPRGGEGGVFQYDFGKSIQGQSFQHTRFLNQPPTTLRTAMTGIQAQYKRKGHRLQEVVNNILDKNTRLCREYSRPSLNTDRLFKPEVIHGLGCCDESCEDDPSNLILRSRRVDDEDDPAIHYGLIASGNNLMKDAFIRDRLAAEKDVLCFEMEAAGLLNTFPCLVIRGICDYSDSHKSKGWQGYAAMVAAAYAKDLLQRIPLNRIEAEERISVIISDKLEGTILRLDRLHSQHEQHHREDMTIALTNQQQRCHQALKIANYTEQKNINPKRADGTCQWALQSPEYIRWRESNCNDLLWVSADPGCGKSVLARSIIDEYLEAPSPAVTICFFFFKDNDEQKDLATALCSVLHQLFSQQPHLLSHAMPSWNKNGEKLRHEVDELWQIFMMVTSTDVSYKTICIFDALDECRDVDQDRLIEKLQIFHRQPCSSTRDTYLKLLVTSRPYGYIQNRFRAITDFCPHIHLKGEEENDQIHREIDLVVKIRVKELATTALLSREVQQRVEQQLLQMKHRTYLWLYLALDDIRSTFEDSLRPAEESIRMIPPSVDAAYEKILSRIPPSQVYTVRKVLQIIVAARRPLTTAEMAMALGIAIYPESRTTADATLDPSQIGKKLRRLCGLFVFINNAKFYLIHQTAREFLVAKASSNCVDHLYSWSLNDTEDQMACICLRYLLMEDLGKGEGELCSKTRSFLKYSAVHWPDHVRSMGLTSGQDVSDRLHRLYDMSGKLFSLWSPIFWKAVRRYDYPPAMSALEIASFNGHEQVVGFLLSVDKGGVNTADTTETYPVIWASLNGHDQVVHMLLENGADVNTQGGVYGNALYAACARGHVQIVQMLLQRGADVNAHGGEFGHGGNALRAASAEGYDQIVQVLLENGVEVNAQSGFFGNGGNALQAACSGGHIQIVQMLLQRGANINAQCGVYGNALQAACSKGCIQIVQILLQRGANINAQGGEYGNALQASCSGGHDQVVQILLERGANVNAPGGEYGNALQAACFGGHDQVTQKLLQRGADVNAQGGRYRSALQAACSRGYEQIVRILLEQGAIDTKGNDYRSALEAACSRGYDQVVRMLLEQGAINTQGRHYRKSLQAACYRGHDQIVQMLFQRGANVNAQGGEYGNALQAACSGGHNHVVQILLERGADVNAQGGRYGNALQAACFEGHIQIVRIILENGAEVNAQGGDYGNALQAACSEGHIQILQMLLQCGANVNAQGGEYENALQAACSGGYDQIVQILLERGANINDRGGGYGNALQAACSEGHDKVVQILLERGADVNAQGGDYENALYTACARGYDQIVQILLEHGADVNDEGGLSGNALQAACSGGHDQIVQMLLDRGANINAEGGLSGNALQAACYRGHAQVVQILLERGADVNAKGGLSGNALQAACSGRHNYIVRMLLERGANVNGYGGRYGNALQEACSGGQEKILQFLQQHQVAKQSTSYPSPKRLKISGGL